MRAATEGVQADRVVAVGLGSQVDGVVACDADGAPLRPAIIWLDKRATEQCDRLVAAVGSDVLAERTGLVADASHSAPKMMWIRENEPRVWQRAAVLAPVGSYVLHHLTGTHAQDAANASSTMVYDVTKGDFDAELCEAAGLDPAMLPPVRSSTEVVGTLRPELAAEFGLSARCTVVVGTGDEHAASAAEALCGSPPGCSACRRARCSNAPGRRRRPARACCSCPRCRGPPHRGGTTACVARSSASG